MNIFRYERDDCEYTIIDNILFMRSSTRHDISESWVKVDIEHCVAKGINHFEVFKHFGRLRLYVEKLVEIGNIHQLNK